MSIDQCSLESLKDSYGRDPPECGRDGQEVNALIDGAAEAGAVAVHNAAIKLAVELGDYGTRELLESNL